MKSKNLSSVYVTVYFREYKYQPYDSAIGLYRLGVPAEAGLVSSEDVYIY